VPAVAFFILVFLVYKLFFPRHASFRLASVVRLKIRFAIMMHENKDILWKQKIDPAFDKFIKNIFRIS